MNSFCEFLLDEFVQRYLLMDDCLAISLSMNSLCEFSLDEFAQRHLLMDVLLGNISFDELVLRVLA